MIKSQGMLVIPKLYFSKFPKDLTQEVSKANPVHTHISLTGVELTQCLLPCDTPTLPGEGAKHANVSSREESANAKAKELK